MKLLSFSQLFWRSISLIFFSFFLLPVIFVLASLFTDYNDNWSHLINFVLTDYILNSIYLIAGVSILSLLFGVGTAWLVTNYDFLGRGWQEWALILPLAVPPYILAYTFIISYHIPTNVYVLENTQVYTVQAFTSRQNS